VSDSLNGIQAQPPALWQRLRWSAIDLFQRLFPGKGNCLRHAEDELVYLRKSVPDALVLEFEKEILALVKAFGHSGQSGGSAPYTAKAITRALDKLLMFDPIMPITGEDWEWNELEPGMMGRPNVKQNKRLSSVFMEDGQAHYLNAVVFRGNEDWDTFVGEVEGVSSCLNIKGFPFEPKTFYIDVVRTPNTDHPDRVSCGGGDYLYTIKDREQLKAVYDYYDPRE